MLLRGELSTVTLRPAQARVHHGPSRATTSGICNCVHNCQPERRGSHSELLTERPEPPDGTVTALRLGTVNLGPLPSLALARAAPVHLQVIGRSEGQRQRKTPSAACDRDIMYTLTLAQQEDEPPRAVYFWCPTGRHSHCAPRRGSPGLSPCIGIFQNARRDRSIGSALTGKKHTKHLHITQIRWYPKQIRKRHMASSGKGHVISTPM